MVLLLHLWDFHFQTQFFFSNLFMSHTIVELNHRTYVNSCMLGQTLHTTGCEMNTASIRYVTSQDHLIFSRAKTPMPWNKWRQSTSTPLTCHQLDHKRKNFICQSKVTLVRSVLLSCHSWKGDKPPKQMIDDVWHC